MTVSSARCRQCGARLPAGTPGELCPLCVADEEPPENGVRVLGDCELFEEIGRGGMGVVWRGRQRGLDRAVAVKTLPGGDLAGAEARARFRIEAQAAARLHHPNIVAVHDVGEADGMPYFVMELVSGRTLGAVIAEKVPPPRTSARWLQEAALAVQHAHEHGVLHRDLKPSNILLEPAEGGERPRVTDFGLAKLTDTESGLTLSGSAAGSPAYMPPEQARGAPSTALSDVYGLGAVLYTALTGRAPYQGDTVAAILAQVEREEPIPPRRLHPAVPRDLETVCLKCLEKNPARRYATARALAEDLQRFLDGEPVLARPVGLAGKAIRRAARRPALAAALALALLALVATAIVSTVAALRIDEARDRALASADSEKRHAKEARRRAVDLHVAEANRRQADGDFIASLPPLVAALRSDDGDRSGHATRLAAALRQCPRVVHHWTLGAWRDRRDPALTWPGRVYSADFSPDGKWIAAATMAKTIHLWNAETGEDAGAAFDEDYAVYVKFSGDGKRLLLGTGRDTLSLWDVAQRTAIFRDVKHDLNGTHPSSLIEPVMDREARRIARVEPGDGLLSGVYVVLPDKTGESGAPLSIPLRLNSRVRSLALAPDGSRLAIGLQGGGVVLHETGTWAPPGRVFHAGKTARTMRFSPDNQRLAVLSGANDVQLWQLDTDPPAPLGQAGQHHGATYTLAWSPDGARVASAAFGERASLVLRADAGLLEAIARQPPGAFSTVWKPDGTAVLTAGFDNAARFFDPLTGEASGPPLHHGAYVSAALFSPDGRRVFTGAYDGTARLWELPQPPAAPAEVANSKSSAGGRFLARRDWKEGTLGMLVIHNMADGGIAGRTGPGRCAGLADNGRTLVWLGGDKFELHEFRDGQPRTLSAFAFPYDSAPAAAREVEITPDAARAVITADRKTWQVWDITAPQAARTGTLQMEARGTQLAFSADGTLMASVSARPQREAGALVIVWNLRTCTEVSRFATVQGIACIEFSPDSRLIAWGGRRGDLIGASARMHRCADGQPVTPFLTHRGDIEDVEFTPDSRLLATGCRDGYARLWKADSGELAGPELFHPHHVVSVSFTRDGARMVTLHAGAAPAMRVWETASGVAVTPPLRLGRGHWLARFTDDGSALITAGDTFVHWPLSDGERSVEALVEEAEFLSARRHDPVTGERPIPAADLKALDARRPRRGPAPRE